MRGSSDGGWLSQTARNTKQTLKYTAWGVGLVLVFSAAAGWLNQPLQLSEALPGSTGSPTPHVTPGLPVAIAGVLPPSDAGGSAGASDTDRDDTPPSLASSSPGDWPMYGHDISRTNYNPAETTLSPGNVGQLVSRWQAATGMGGAPTSSGPSMANGLVYVGSSLTSGPNFFAFDAATGAPAWSAILGPSPTCFSIGIGATAAISGSIVVAGGADAAYYGLDAQTGEVLWRSALNAGASAFAWASPLIMGDRAYIGVSSGCDNPSVRGEVRALKLQDGTILSSQAFVPQGQAGAGIWNSPALSPNGQLLVVPTGEDYGGYNGPYNRAMVSLDPISLVIHDANQQGPTGQDNDYATSPVVFHDSLGRTLVAAHHKDDNFYVYNLNDLSAGPVWRRETGTIIGMMPAYDPTLNGDGALFLMDGLGNLHAVDPGTGTDLWPPVQAGTAHGNMAIANGMVFLNTGAGGVRVFAEKDGRSLATLMPEHAGDAYSGIAVAHGFVYWLSGGYLNAWSLPAGQ